MRVNVRCAVPFEKHGEDETWGFEQARWGLQCLISILERLRCTEGTKQLYCLCLSIF